MNRASVKNVFLYILPPFIYAGLVFYLSSLPSWKIRAVSSFPDYILHFIEYAVFAWLTLRLLKYINKGIIKPKAFVFIIIILAIFAASDEWHQSFVPGRFATFWDFTADFLGIITALGIYHLYNKYK
jgi:VanZ family protein